MVTLRVCSGSLAHDICDGDAHAQGLGIAAFARRSGPCCDLGLDLETIQLSLRPSTWFVGVQNKVQIVLQPVIISIKVH